MRFFLVLFCALFTYGSARAQVVVTELQPLSFGTMIVDPGGDTVRLRTNGNIRTSSGSDLQGGHSVGIFRFEDTGNSSVSYSFSANNMLTGSGGTLMLENFVTSRPNPFQLGGSGVREMNIGADLIIPPNIQGGSFSGTFVLTIDNP